MDPAKWAKVKEVMADAMELPAHEQEAFVVSASAGDAEIEREVRSLMNMHTRAPGSVLAASGPSGGTLVDAIVGTSADAGDTGTIGRYAVVRRLGSGGMGSVFEATDPALARSVAIKVLHAGLASGGGAGFKKRFDAEAQVLARLQHPAIAQVYETGVARGPGGIDLPFIAMELVRGGVPIDRHVHDKHLALRPTLALFATVCDAVHHGHVKGVIHRDLKPANVLIDEEGNPKVIDFGVARIIESAESATRARGTRTLDMVGTPNYMAPEALERGTATVDARGDVYALGVLLYELLAKEAPYRLNDITPAKVVATLRATPTPKLSKSRAECAGDIETIVEKAIARSADDRYQSVSEFAADIRRFLANEPIVAKPPTTWRQVALFARRRRDIVAAAAIVCAAAVVAIAGLGIGIAKAREGERIAKEQAAKAERTSEFLRALITSTAPDPKVFGASEITRGPRWRARQEGGTVTLNDLLYSASEQVPTWFESDADLAADMAVLLARSASFSQTTIGREDMYLRALALCRKAYGDDSPRTIDVMLLVASNLVLQNEHPEIGRELSLEAYERSRRIKGPGDYLTLRAASAVGSVLRRDERATFFVKAREGVASDDRRAHVLLDLIEHVQMSAQVKVEDRVPENMEAYVNAAREVLGPQDPMVQGGMLDLCLAFNGRGDFANSTRVAQQLLAYVGEPHDTQSFFCAYEALSALYFASNAGGDLRQAAALAMRQAELADRFLPAANLNNARAHARAARMLLEAGLDKELAFQHATQAVTGTPALLAENEGWSTFHEAIYGWALRERGQQRFALEVLEARVRREVAMKTKVMPWVVMQRNVVMADCKMDLGDLEGVDELLAAAWVGYDEWGDPKWPTVRVIRKAQARYDALTGTTSPRLNPSAHQAP